jgi:hypothetical protein
VPLREEADDFSGQDERLGPLVGFTALAGRVSTGKAPNVRINPPSRGTRKSASQAMKRMGRRTWSERRTGSRYDGWFAATTAGPLAGTFSSPRES